MGVDDIQNPIQHLEGMIKDMASTFKDEFGNLKNGLNLVKEKQEEIEVKVAAYDDAVKRGGLPAPMPDSGMTLQQSQELFWGYDMARQGKLLSDKLRHPAHQVPEALKPELAKFWILFLRAGLQRNDKARAEFEERYAADIARYKTAVGDTGNVFPVPDVLQEQVLAYAREASVSLQDSLIWDMTSEKTSVPAETASPSLSWGNTTPESEPTVEEVELSVYEYSAYAAVRNTTLADAISDVVSWLTESMAEAQGLGIDDITWNGDGTEDYGYCSGILTAACGYSVIMGSGYTNFSSLLDTDLSNMIAQLDGLRKVGAKFYMHGQILHYVRILKDSQNRPIFVESVGSDVPGKIFGYPYKEVVKMPSTSASNTPFLSFGNMRRGFVVGRRLYSTALDANPYEKWTTNRTCFKLYSRMGGKIVLANNLVRLLTNSG